MAEFALGLTKTTVEGVLTLVKSAIDEDARLKVQVQNDLMFITGEFQMMQAFLKAANQERANNEVVRAWVTQIRDLAFDVEDCIEFVVHLDMPSSLDWVRRLAWSCICKRLPLDLAVNQIQQLKARVEDVSQRNIRYNLSDSGSGSKSNSKPVNLDSDTPKIMAGTTGTSSTAFHILSEAWEAVGKKKHSLGDLKLLICGKGGDLEVISVWGSTEAVRLEAPHIIRKAYCDREICHQFRSRAWVKLVHPYRPEEFLESLLTQLYACSSQATSNQVGTREDHGLIKAELMQQVKEHRYLIVVEGVSTVAEWDAIKIYLPDNKNGSRVIVYTEQLENALLCTGEPYQVTELSRFPDDQSLCAFLSEPFGHRLYVGELVWQISCRGVIAVCDEWGGKPVFPDQVCLKSTLLDQVFDCFTLEWKELEGLKFRWHSWVDVPDPFNLNVFSRRLLVNFHSDHFKAEEMAEVGLAGVIERCCRFLRYYDCLVVINGLKSTADWDEIEANFLSEPIIGCILIIVHAAERVATHCVDRDTKVFNIQDLESDLTLGRLIKGREYNGFVSQQASHTGRLFSNRRTNALNWLDKFGQTNFVRHNNRVTSHLLEGLEFPGVISFWGTLTIDKSVVVRLQYYSLMTKETENPPFSRFCWVNVPCPFSLKEFCWRFLLEFFSDSPESKEMVTFAMLEGHDPIPGIHSLLCDYRCLVVIDDLRFTDDWDLIAHACLSEQTKCSIIVITDRESVAYHCVDERGKAFNVNDPEVDVIHSLFDEKEKEGFYCRFEGREIRKLQKKSRTQEAREWTLDVELIGRRDELLDLDMRLYMPSVTCISGMTGVGKSSLVRCIYYNQMHVTTGDHFHDNIKRRVGFSCYSWVDVPHPFNLKIFCWRLLLDFHSDHPQTKVNRAVMIESQDPIQQCLEYLRDVRCFVVVDGLRTTGEWDLIRAALLREHTTATIFIITNEESVARHVRHDYAAVKVKCLKASAAHLLFTKKLEPENGFLHESEVSKLIIAKCGGIPRVIDAASKYVAIYYREGDIGSLEYFCDNFVHVLKTYPQFSILKGLFSWMRSYFDACSDSVKPCIFYLSVFPAHGNIRLRRLLRRWVAEGYSRDTSTGISADQIGQNLFSELFTLSIIQQHSDNKAMFQVNGFFREYIISQPMEDNRVFALERHCSVNSQRACQHLTILSSWDRDQIVFESIDFTRLRSLTVFGDWRPFFIPKSDSNSMRLLRVLDLEDTSGLTDGDIKQIGNLVPRLKFLSLRGCTGITYLPCSLGNMRQLQTLDIKNTSIVSLPPFIVKLQKLQYVSAGTTVTPDGVRDSNDAATVAADQVRDSNGSAMAPDEERDNNGTTVAPDEVRDEVQTASTALATRTGRRRCCSVWLPKKLCRCQQLDNGGGGVKVPAVGMGNLTALHTISVVNVGAVGGKGFLKELTKLTQLRKLRVSRINRKNWHDLCVAISLQAHLETLSVRLDDEQHLCRLDEISKPPKKLKSLKLYGGNLHVSSAWMINLHHLRKPHLGDLELSVSTQEDIDNLVQLQCTGSYRRFCVKTSQDGVLHYGREMGLWYGQSFKDAKILKIDCSSYKSKIVFGKWIPDFVELIVVHCSASEASLELCELRKLSNLKEVRLEGCYSDGLKQHLQQKIDELPSSRRVVLKLVF